MVNVIMTVLADVVRAALAVALAFVSIAIVTGAYRRATDALRKWRETARHIDAAKRRAWNEGYKCGHKDGRKQGRKEATSK